MFQSFSNLYKVITLSILTQGIFTSCLPGEESLADKATEEVNQVYLNKKFHNVPNLDLADVVEETKAKNVILMIGDGMGSAQIFAGALANKGKLNILELPHTGFSTTRASNNDITDSAAAATALASGVKTYNGAIGVASDTTFRQTILELAEAAGKSTGLVATSRITHATPACFIAHQPQRSMYEEIAADFLKTDIDVFIGGGRGNFNARQDSVDLLAELVKKGYQVVTSTDSLPLIESGKLAGLITEGDPNSIGNGRGNMLETATETSLRILSQNPNGFFLMIEGSQIDWGGHSNQTDYVVEEMLDFDKAIGLVIEFAANNPGTLVIITADHETGGFSIIDADMAIGKVEGAFGTGSHTAVMVPVFAYGPLAHTFNGTYPNTDIFYKMKTAFGW